MSIYCSTFELFAKLIHTLEWLYVIVMVIMVAGAVEAKIEGFRYITRVQWTGYSDRYYVGGRIVKVTVVCTADVYREGRQFDGRAVSRLRTPYALQVTVSQMQ